MKNTQKPDRFSLNTLIRHLQEGYFVIPNFQREFEWKPPDIRALMRSIFLDYYIGSLLLWKGKEENFEAMSCEEIYGFIGDDKRRQYIVLDGQQRLAAIYYAFLAPDVPLPGRATRAFYFVRVDKFMNEEYDEAFGYDWSSKRFLKILNDREIQFSQHIFPLSVVGAEGWELPNWVQDYEQYWKNAATDAKNTDDEEAVNLAEMHAENAKIFGKHLKDITNQYQVSYIELDQELELDKVCDIFTQINSRGIRLDVFDLINALLVPKGINLKHMWREAEARLEFVDSERMNVYILQVMSILRQAYCSPKYLYFLLPGQEKPIRDPDGTRHKEILVPDVNDFEKRWNQAVDSLENAIKMLRHPQEFGAVSSKYLPYISILPPFAALQAYVKTCSSGLQLDAQRKIKHWYWAAVFTNQYSGSVESTSARDFLDVKTWIETDMEEPALIREFKNTFRAMDLRREVRYGSSVYNGIFNLLVLQGARDWITGKIPQPEDLDDHHIVPSWWGAENLDGKIVNTILNRTPLTADTNRKGIAGNLPNVYLLELIKNNGEERVLDILQSHFISQAALNILLRDPFTPDDFDEFITERQRTIQDAIENLLIKERLDLPPDLRKMDVAIEETELGLRNAVMKVLGSNASALPQHVQQKIEERLQRASKKNAALDVEYYQTLKGKLEYCDLRELQDTITSKKIWPEFQSRFSNKETLKGKFDQLAELRNSIRHSRTVDEVTRMEGGASLLWFKEVLER